MLNANNGNLRALEINRGKKGRDEKVFKTMKVDLESPSTSYLSEDSTKMIYIIVLSYYDGERI